MNMDIQIVQNFIDTHPVLVIVVILWSLIWKGLALWQAASGRKRNWFIVILVLNTLGILEIIYLFFVLPRRAAPTAVSPESERVS